MPKAAKKTWVVIVDGAGGQIFDLALPAGRLTPLRDAAFHGTRALTRDLTSDRPGHTRESVGGARHAMEPRTDAHRHAEQELARQVVARITRDGQSRAYDQLIVVAPPRTLGDLRATLSEQVRKRVRLEVKGEWTKLSPTEAAAHLRPHLEKAALIPPTA